MCQDLILSSVPPCLAALQPFSARNRGGPGLFGALAGFSADDGYLEAVVGAVIATVVVVLLAAALVVVRYMFRHKGSYWTNEAKGTEFAETADVALRADPALQDAVDHSRREYFI